MIVITGATGRLGSLVVAGLLDRLPPEEIGVSVRDPAQAADLAARGVRVRRGDFADAGSLASAFEGADQVLVVSVNTLGEPARAQHRAAIDAAAAAGAGRVLYTSHQGAAHDSLFRAMPDHAATEDHLAGCGIPWTSLRNGFYASTIPMLLGNARETGELRAPVDGPVSWTTHEDLAAATVAILCGGEAYDGATPPLTASRALDLAAVADELGITRVVVGDDEWVGEKVAHGMPEEAARMVLDLFHASARGEFAATDPTLARVTGREPRSLRSVLPG